MKILILDTYYPGFLNFFYSQQPNISADSYNQHRQKLLDYQFGTADFYSKNLSLLGHDAQDLIINDPRLQKKWAREHNLTVWNDFYDRIPVWRIWHKSPWLEKILLNQINDFEPDIVYCQDLSCPSQTLLKKIKRKRRLIVGQVASAVECKKDKLAAFDLIVSSMPHLVKQFRAQKINSEYLGIGFGAKQLARTRPALKFDTVFVGGFSRHHLKDPGFVKNFEYVAQKTKIDFWGYGIKNLSPDSVIRKTYHGELWGKDMYTVLGQAKIGINRHIPAAENNANNMRLFETTGMGALLITDHKTNLNHIFTIDKEVVSYKTKEELEEKILYYLSHEKERQQIAKQGQKKTLSRYTYTHRMKELETILHKYI